MILSAVGWALSWIGVQHPPRSSTILCYKCSFLDKTSVEERLHVPIGVKQKKHIRILLGIDQYGAQGLAKTLGITNLTSLFDFYKRNFDSKSVPAMTKQLGSAMFSQKAAASLVQTLEEMRVAELTNGPVAERMLLLSIDEDGDPDDSKVESDEEVVSVEADTCLDAVGAREGTSASGKEEEEAEEGPAGSGSGGTFLTQVLEGTPDPHRASLSAPGGDLEGSALDLSSLLRGDAGTTSTAPVTACQEAYETACRQADTVPVARFLHGLGGFECGLAHFGVGPLGMRPIAEALRMNPPLRVLSLADNRITEAGGDEVVRFIAFNTTLTSLDLADNQLGTFASRKIFKALAWNITLQAISLRGNNIKCAAGKEIAGAIAACVALTSLDLSFNSLGDAGLADISVVLPVAPKLANLNLAWNHISNAGATSIANGLIANSSLETLDLGWNGIGESGGIRLGEVMATNRVVRHVLLANNRITAPAALVIGDSLRFNSVVEMVDLSNNPLGKEGVSAILGSVSNRSNLARFRLVGTSIGLPKSAASAAYSQFNAARPDGVYSLNLEEHWDHAVAELLRMRAIQTDAKFMRPTLNGVPVPSKKLLNLSWKIPQTGKLDFTFVTTRVSDPSEGETSTDVVPVARPCVSFELDLANPVDHKMAVLLVEQAIKEPGENWINEKLDGVPFNFNEEENNVAWIKELHTGVLTLDYITTGLSHEASYALDLSIPSEHSLMYKLLDRVYSSLLVANAEGTPPSCCIADLTLDGEPVELDDWRRGISVGALWVKGSVVRSKSAKSHWRLPNAGLAKFQFCAVAPCCVDMERLSFDVSSAEERNRARKLWVLMQRTPGDSWWNQRIDGFPINVLSDEGGFPVLPARGTLTVDYVRLRPKELARHCRRGSYTLDLSVRMERALAKVMRLRSLMSLASARGDSTAAAPRRRRMSECGVEMAPPGPGDTRTRRASTTLVAAVGEDTVLPLCSNTGPDVRLSQSLAVLAMVGLTSNGDPEEEYDEDWSLDPWLYEHMDDSDEFTSELSIDGEPIPVTTFLDPSFEWPREGTMSIVYTYFSDREPMSASNYAAIIQELKEQASDIDRVLLLQIISNCASENSFKLTCDMALAICQTASSLEEVSTMCDVLRTNVVDAHRLVLLKGAVERIKTAKRVLAAFGGKR